MPEKQKCYFLNSRFFESARYVLIYNSSYDNYFSIILFLGVTEGNSADTKRAGFLSKASKRIWWNFCQSFNDKCGNWTYFQKFVIYSNRCSKS